MILNATCKVLAVCAFIGMVASGAGVEASSAETRFPAFLSVPQTAAPAMDGKLDDPAWQNAASFVSLLDQTTPDKSLSYPDNRPLTIDS